MDSQRKNNQGQSQNAFMNERWLRKALKSKKAGKVKKDGRNYLK